MASNHELFWENNSFAVVGHAAKKNFPRLTYRGLKKLRKVVFPSGTCAVMYLTPDLTYHSIHKWIMKLTGKY